jgi:hypothetical protein
VTISVTLSGALAGAVIEVNGDGLTMGMIEDLQGGTAGLMLDAVASVIVGGDLPHGADRAGLRRLTPVQFAAVCEGIAGCLSVPKGR